MVEEKETKLKKIKTRIINFFKSPREVITFFLPIVITAILLIPLPYYVKLVLTEICFPPVSLSYINFILGSSWRP